MFSVPILHMFWQIAIWHQMFNWILDNKNVWIWYINTQREYFLGMASNQSKHASREVASWTEKGTGKKNHGGEEETGREKTAGGTEETGGTKEKGGTV